MKFRKLNSKKCNTLIKYFLLLMASSFFMGVAAQAHCAATIGETYFISEAGIDQKVVRAHFSGNSHYYLYMQVKYAGSSSYSTWSSKSNAGSTGYFDVALPQGTNYLRLRRCDRGTTGSAINCSYSSSKSISVKSQNAPYITPISNTTINEDQSITIYFNIYDAETPTADLTVGMYYSTSMTFKSMPTYQFGGSGSSRWLKLTPKANDFGEVTLVVGVREPSGRVNTTTFVFKANPVNDAPTTSNITNKSINEDSSTGDISFTIDDVDNSTSSLSLSATSSNTALIPNSNIVLSGSGGDRKIRVTPAANKYGTSTISVTVSDGNKSIVDTFVVTVNSVNDLPTISDIANRAINEDANTGNIGFTVGDVETSAGSLIVTATSSNIALVPNGNLQIGGSGSSRTIKATPLGDKFGTTTITVTVKDANGATRSDSFTLTVNSVNDQPTISAIADRTINEDGSTGSISFTVSDVETAAGSLALSYGTSSSTLASTPTVQFGGSGGSRTVTVTPKSHDNGVIWITVYVKDANNATASEAFKVSVNAVNDAPTISDITNKTINEDSNTGNIAFTIGDVETSPSSLSLSRTSSNTSLIPNSNISFGGSGANRTVKVTPVANASGSSTISVTVSDGEKTKTDTFVVTVNAVNDEPVLQAIGTQNLSFLGNHSVNFTVSDIDNVITASNISLASSEPSVIDAGAIDISLTEPNGVLNFLPAMIGYGTSIITLTASDGALSRSVQFNVNVSEVTDVSGIGSQLDTSAIDPSDGVPASSYFGALKGEYTVTPSAAFNYSMPIGIPPGINGMQPQLSLSYSSQRKNGLVGYGWMLGGLSSITRCKATLVQDGYVSGIQPGDNYKYCLDGQRLVQVDTNQYRLENEAYLHISYDTNANLWRVVDRMGVVSMYGGVQNARLEDSAGTAHTWHFNYKSDIFGNSYSVNYIKEFEDDMVLHRPASIAYSLNGSVSTNHEIIFGYEDRDDVVVKYIAGKRQKYSKRLSSITINSNNVRVKKYSLRYQEYGEDYGGTAYLDPVKTSRLHEVGLCFSNDTMCAKTVSFDWTAQSEENYQLTTDYVETYNALSKLQDGASHPDVDAAAYLHLGGDNWIDGYYVLREQYARYHVVDIDGDGFKDIVKINAADSAPEPGLMVYRNIPGAEAGTRQIDSSPLSNYFIPREPLVQYGTNRITVIYGYGPGGESASDPVTQDAEYPLRTEFVDMNSDGYVDLVTYSPNGCPGYSYRCTSNDLEVPIKVLYNTGSGWTRDAQNGSLKFLSSGLTVGLRESVAFVDMNADGLPDAVKKQDRIDDSELPQVFFNASAGASTQISFNEADPGYETRSWNERYMGDFNGDGIKDYIHMRSGKSWILAFTGKGDGSFEDWREGAYWDEEDELAFRDDDSLILTGCGADDYEEYSCVRSIADFNGDGLSDVFIGSGPKAHYEYYTCEEMGGTDCPLDRYQRLITEDPTRGQIQLSLGTDENGLVKFSDPIDIGIISDSVRFTQPGKSYPVVADYNRDGYMDFSIKDRFTEKLQPHRITAIHERDNIIRPTYGLINQDVVSTSIESGANELNSGDVAVSQDIVAPPRIGVTGVVISTYFAERVWESYEYQNAIFQRDGWGNLGYGKVIKKRKTAEYQDYWLKTETDYYQIAREAYKVVGKPSRIRVYKVDAANESIETLLSDTRHRWAVRAYSDDVDSQFESPHYYIHLYESSTQKYSLWGKATGVERTFYHKPSEFSCDPIDLSDLSNLLDEALLFDASDETLVGENGVVKYISTVACDAANSNLPADLGTANQYRIGVKENLDITTKGNRRGLVQKTKSAAWTGESLPAVDDAAFEVRTKAFSFYSDGKLHIEEIEPDLTSPNTYHLKTTYTYNVYGSVSSELAEWDDVAGDGLAATSANVSYDETWLNGQRTVVTTRPLLPSETTVYHPVHGLPVSHTDANGLLSEFEYDDLGRETRVVHKDGKITKTAYVDCQNCFSESNTAYDYWYKKTKTTGEPAVIEAYSSFDQPKIQITRGMDGNRRYKKTEYDRNRRKLIETVWYQAYQLKSEYFTRQSYDILNRVTEVSRGDGAIKTYNYDTRKVTITNELNQTQTRYVNSSGQVLRSVDNVGAHVDYTYSPWGDLKTTTVTDQTGSGTTNTQVVIGYDLYGRRTSLSDPNAGYSSYTHNALGLVSSQTDGNNIVTQYHYDVLGRKTQQIDDATGIAKTHNWYYDLAANGKGMLSSVSGMNTDGSAYAESYSYNSYSLPVGASRSFGGKTYTVTQHYDDFNRPLATSYPSGFTLVNHYNSWGYVVEQSSLLDGTLLWQATEADDQGNITESTLGNGVTTSREFNPLTGLLKSVVAAKSGVGTVMSHSYQFDYMGRLEWRTDHVANLTQTFTYDDGMNRVTGVESSDGSLESFGYDDFGNITSKHGVDGSFEYGTINTAGSLDDAGPHAVVSAGGFTYRYDNNGNVVRVLLGANTVSSVSYSSMNKPLQITNNGTSTAFVYDANHSRIKRTDGDGTVTTYGVLGLYEVVERGGSTDQIHYIGDYAMLVVRTGLNAGKFYRYLHRDHLGSVVAYSPENLSTISAADMLSYGIWGDRRLMDWTGVPWGDSFEPDTSARGFTDHEHLDGVGLIHMNGRVYDPRLGRFLSADPLVQAPYNTQSYNRYSYVFNNPVSFVDPSGYATECGDPGPVAPGGVVIWDCEDEEDIDWNTVDYLKKNIAREQSLRDQTNSNYGRPNTSGSEESWWVKNVVKPWAESTGIDDYENTSGYFTDDYNKIIFHLISGGGAWVGKLKFSLAVSARSGADKAGFAADDFVITDPMSPKRFRNFLKDVAANGLKDKNILYVVKDGVPHVIYGSNRLHAAKLLGWTNQLKFKQVYLPQKHYYTFDDVIQAPAPKLYNLNVYNLGN